MKIAIPTGLNLSKKENQNRGKFDDTGKIFAIVVGKGQNRNRKESNNERHQNIADNFFFNGDGKHKHYFLKKGFHSCLLTVEIQFWFFL
jgi:hypothetical protein